MVEDAVGDVDVVLDQVSLAQPLLGEEAFLQVRQPDFPAAYPHPVIFAELP
jgi:hypothetical protein